MGIGVSGEVISHRSSTACSTRTTDTLAAAGVIEVVVMFPVESCKHVSIENVFSIDTSLSGYMYTYNTRKGGVMVGILRD